MSSEFAKITPERSSKASVNNSTSKGMSMPAVPALLNPQNVIQKLDKEDDEPVQKKPLQFKNYSIQRQQAQDEPLQKKPFQLKSDPVQRQTPDEQENPLQGKFIPAQRKENTTGLPDNLKTGVENLSGIDISDVKVYYNSPKSAQLQALAYAQGTDIHVGPGQERHLPHEAWHVVQQKQGRVQPTVQMKEGVAVNDDKGLEHEADVMGTNALKNAVTSFSTHDNVTSRKSMINTTIQRRMGIEAELTVPVTDSTNNSTGESRVRSFLGDGVGYKQQFQADANGFHIDTDKDPIAQKVRAAKDYVNMQLVTINGNTRKNRGKGSMFLEGIASLFGTSYDQHTLIPQESLPVANMEYVSQPFNEETILGRQGLQNAMLAMQADMNIKLANGRSGLHNQGQYNYGVPATADWREFAQNTGINELALLNRRDIIINAITDRLYVQVTAGILPAGIPKLQKEAANDRDVTGQVDSLGITQIEEDLAKIRALVTSRSAIVAEDVVDQLIKKSGKLFGIRKEDRLLQSLKGYLGLINSYIFAEAVIKAHIGTVHKNMIPFFSKLPLNEAQKALDLRVRPELWSGAERTELAKLMNTHIRDELDRVTGFFKKPYYGGITVDQTALTQVIVHWLPDVLAGTGDDFSDAQLEACTSIQPEVHDKSQPILEPAPGPVNAVQPSTEKVLALEYRMIRENLDLTPATFMATVNQIMDQIRRSNA